MLRLLLFFLVPAPLLAADTAAPVIHLNQEKDKDTRLTITGIAQEVLRDSKRYEAAVYVARGNRDEQLAMLGSWKVEKETLCFAPRFPLSRGVPYRVVVKIDGKATEKIVSLPKPQSKPSTVVSEVYPTADKLPENQLKFYLHFSAPMAQGGVYEHLSLVDADGKKVELPFLELDQELWDRSGRRFTLFFDPGRVKRGLKPREEFGPVLEEGKRYSLVIERSWLDAEGNPLKQRHVKSFSVGPPDDVQPDIKTWKLKQPTNPTAPLVVTFPESMDHALALRMIWIEDERGERVDCKSELSDRETVLTLTPEKPWKSGRYHLVADNRLEDLAGNSLGRLFEVDVLQPVDRQLKTETVKVPFELK